MRMVSCWNCAAQLEGVPLPLSRGEQCPHCLSALRTCRMCRFYDPHTVRACREPMADPVSRKDSANTCDYFSPALPESEGNEAEAEAARRKLAALFGPDTSAPSPSLKEELAAHRQKSESEQEASRRKLREFFNKGDTTAAGKE